MCFVSDSRRVSIFCCWNHNRTEKLEKIKMNEEKPLVLKKRIRTRNLRGSAAENRIERKAKLLASLNLIASFAWFSVLTRLFLFFFFKSQLLARSCRRRAKKAVHELRRWSARWPITAPPSRRPPIRMHRTSQRARPNWAHWPVSTSHACKTFSALSYSFEWRGSSERRALSRDSASSPCAALA